MPSFRTETEGGRTAVSTLRDDHGSQERSRNYRLLPEEDNDDKYQHFYVDPLLSKFEHEAFVTDMMAASQRRKYDIGHYKKVEALLLNWEPEELKIDKNVETADKIIEDEVKAVRELFEKEFRFSADRFIIPSIDPKTRQFNSQNKLLSKVKDWLLEHDDKETLLIIYYNGFSGPIVEWNRVETSIFAKADVLMVLDSICARRPRPPGKGKEFRSRTEILAAACGSTRKERPPFQHSFTMAFIQVVKNMLALKSHFTVEEIFIRMLGQQYLDPEPFYEASEPSLGSIPLRPQPKTEAARVQSVKRSKEAARDPPSGPNKALISELRDMPMYLHNALTFGDPPSEASSVTAPVSRRVTLVVRLKDDCIPTASDWRALIDALPEEAVGFENVKVEAVCVPVSIIPLLCKAKS
jgi:hypothetical protein